MKHISLLLYLIAFVLCGNAVYAQPQMTRFGFPRIGTTYAVADADTNIVKFTTAGANMTWDFSATSKTLFRTDAYLAASSGSKFS